MTEGQKSLNDPGLDASDSVTSSDSIEPVELLADDFMRRQRAGEHPTLDEYCEKYPELADEIRDVFPALVVIEQVAPDSADLKVSHSLLESPDHQPIDRVGDYRIIREVGRGGMGVVYEAEQESLRRRVALKVLPKQHSADEKSLQRFQREARAAARMHHTNIVPVFEVGQADEWVFYAMQLIQGQGLDLVIDDLKRIRTEHSLLKNHGRDRSGTGDDGHQPAAHSIAASLIVGRFQQEDLVAAEELSAAQGQPVATSDSEAIRAYAETILQESGSTVSAVLPGQSQMSSAETDRHGYFQSVAQIGLQSARALSYAHARGIIHRDIKPSNLLLDATGIVWVTDFGLAKTTDEAMTHTGDILGTIRYMSPERFRGQCDNRADIYSLGLTLYEMLVLKPAFSSPDRLRLIELVTRTEPELPRSLDPKIPRDLETIVLKCIDKDARRRYQSADELADDLQHFVDDEPIQARRISSIERLTRWSRRNKALATSMAVVAALLLIINIAGPLMYLQQTKLVDEQTKLVHQLENQEEGLRTALSTAKEATSEAERLRVEANVAEDRTRRNLYFAHMNMADAAHKSGDFARRQELLDHWKIPDGSTDLRGFEWYLLNSQSANSELVHTLRGHTEPVHSVAWSRDGKRIASGAQGPDTLLKIWNADTGKLERTVDNGQVGWIYGIDWHPTNHNLIATASTDHYVRVINVSDGKELWSGKHDHWVFDVKWSPDEKRFASCGWNGDVRIWNWDGKTAEQVFKLDQDSDRSWSVAWSPDGQELAVSSVGSPEIKIWNFETGNVDLLKGHSEVVRGLDWRTDGRLASCGSSGEVFLWNVANREIVQRLIGHDIDESVLSVAWSPADQNRLLTGGGDDTVRVWDTQAAEIVDTILGHSDDVEAISWSHDGRRFVSGSLDHTLKTWKLPTAEPSIDLKDSGQPWSAAWNPNATRIAVGTSDGTLKLLDESGQRELANLVEHDSPATSNTVRQLQFSPDGRLLASGGDDGYLRIWDVQSETLLARCGEANGIGVNDPSYRGIEDLAWHPTENLIVTVGWDNVIRVCDSRTAEVLRRLTVEDGNFSVCFSLNGEFMVTGHGADQPITLWSTRSWKVIGTFASDGMTVKSLQFSPDGKRLAACGGREGAADRLADEDLGWIRIWETGSDEVSQWPMTEVARRKDVFTKLNWTPDGNRLATASLKGLVQLWDVSSTDFRAVGSELMRLRSQRIWVTPLNLSRDGTKLVFASNDSLVIRDASPGYAKVKSPVLLPDLESRVQSGTATPKDLLLRAQIYAAQGDWIKAEQACQDYLRRNADAPWVTIETWITGGFQGGLQTESDLEKIAQAERYSPANAIDEVTQKQLWNAVQATPGEPVVLLGLDKQEGESCFAYAYQRIYSRVPQHAAIFLGNDDFHKLWVNGELLHEDVAAGSFTIDEFVVPVKLNPGWNSLLTKVATPAARGLGFSLRLTSDREQLIAAYENTDQLDQLVKLFDRELQAHPEEKSLLLKRATARWKLGDHVGADRDFAMFLTGREQNASAFVERAEMYSSLGRVDDLLADFNAATALEPENIQLLRRSMEAHLLYDRPQESAVLLESLIELEPDDHYEHFRLAYVLVEAGRVQDYEARRSQMLARWQNTADDPLIADKTALVSLLKPLSGQELEIAAKLAEKAVGANHDGHNYFLVSHGLAKYRQGMQAISRQEEATAEQYLTQAQLSLETAIEGLTGDRPRFKRAQARYTLAMVLHSLQDPQADLVLTESENEYQGFPENASGLSDIYMVRALRTEAIQTITGPNIELINEVEELLAAGEIKTAIERIRDIPQRQLVSGVILMRLLALIEKHRLGKEVLTDTSEKAPMSWEYRFDKPESDWTTTTGGPGWLTGPAPFGSSRGQNTDLQNGEQALWLRREFQLSEIPKNPLKLRLSVAGSARVLLNGVELIHVQDWRESDETHAYLEIDCTDEAAATLRTGANVLAVSYDNSEGSSLIDAGLHVVKEDLWGEILDQSIEQSPENLQLVETRAKRYVREERYLEAAHDYARFASISPSTPGIHALNTASLFALSGDRQAYQSYCQSQIKLVETINGVDGFDEQVTKCCLLLPGVIPTDDLPLAAVLSSLNALAPTDRLYGYRFATLALAAIRAGDFATAHKRLALVERNINSMPPGVTGLIHALRARVLYEEDRELNQEQIDQALQNSMQAIGEQTAFRHLDRTLVGSSLLEVDGSLKHNAIIDELLRREAEQLTSTTSNASTSDPGN